MGFSTHRQLKCLYGEPPMDNFIFKLCYRWTVLLLVVFSFIVTCRLLLGDSFVCMSENFPRDAGFVNAKCYDDGVYTLPAKLVSQKDSNSTIDPSAENFRRYQSYYSWANLLFLLHAFNFYLPHLLWKSYERGYMYRMTAGVQKFFDKEEKRGLELSHLAKYALAKQGKHKRYTTMYIFFEACNCVISLAQTLWLTHFFDVTGVPNILPNVIETWSDFKHFYFPPNSICEFLKTGASGLPQRHRTVCQLPLNSLYMKMYLFLHAWYIILTALCGLVLVYRIVLLVPSFRIFVLKHSSRLSQKSTFTCVCYSISYSDWFFLTRLRNAMSDIDFAQLVDKISLVSKGQDDSKDLNRHTLSEDAMREFDISNVASVV